MSVLFAYGVFLRRMLSVAMSCFEGTDARETEIVNMHFTYSGSAYKRYIYYGGYWYGLQESFDAQIIDEAALLEIYENHYSAYPYLWGY